MSIQAVPFDPDLFVDRKEEQKIFFDTVRTRSGQAYLEFNGVAGQGKSELLRWIYYNAKKEGYISAYIDFELPQYHRPEIYPILQTVADHLSTSISPDFFHAFKEKLPLCLEQLQNFYRDSLENPQDADRRPLKELEDKLATAFHEGLTSLLKSHKVVLCLDSTEKAYPPALRSFEEQVLQHHTRDRNFIIVTAGQEKLVWKNTEIKDLVKQYDLSRLDPRGVHEQMNRLAEKKGFKIEDSDLVSNKMLQLTLGHPFSNYKLIDFWTNGFKTSLNKTIVEDEKRFAQSIRELIESIIKDRILERLQLSEGYPPVKDILWYLAPLRRIEFGTLWYMLSTFLEGQFKGKRFDFFEKLMEEFRTTYIFMPWQLGVGYDLEPVVRNILLWDMRINTPEEYIKVQKILSEQYDKWVAQSHDATQIKNIVERLYHYAAYLQKTREVQDINPSVQSELKRYLQDYFSPEFAGGEVALRDQLNRLLSALESDKELSTLIDIAALLQLIRNFMN